MQLPAYDPAIAASALDDAELDALDSLLAGLRGDAVMNVEALDGYVTALLVGPRPLAGRPSAEWMPPVWGQPGSGEPDAAAGADDNVAPFASGKQKKRLVLQLLRHARTLDTVLARLDTQPEAWEPVLSVADGVDGSALADAEDWCAGFLRAVALDAAAWEPLFDDPELADALAPLAVLGGDDAEAAAALDLDDPLARDAASRAALDAVPLLKARQGR